MAPIFDLINHNHDNPNCDWDDQNGAIITAARHIKAGEELFIDYGVQHNKDILYNYGFAINNNDSPIYFTKIELIEACQAVYGKTKRLCEKLMTGKTEEDNQKLMVLNRRCKLNFNAKLPNQDKQIRQLNLGFFSKKVICNRKQNIETLSYSLASRTDLKSSAFLCID